MSSNPQDSAQEGSSTNNLTAVISSSSSLVNNNNASNSQENNENEMNSSIGSNRSLNNIFPFRINRNIILNNVSYLNNVSSMSLKSVANL